MQSSSIFNLFSVIRCGCEKVGAEQVGAEQVSSQQIRPPIFSCRQLRAKSDSIKCSWLGLVALWSLCLLPIPAQASVDDAINQVMTPISAVISSIVFFKVPVFGAQLPLVVLWLVCAAVFFTFYFKFLNLRGFAHAVKIAKGDYADPNHPGEVSHFQALATAVSGTVGIGNIGGHYFL